MSYRNRVIALLFVGLVFSRGGFLHAQAHPIPREEEAAPGYKEEDGRGKDEEGRTVGRKAVILPDLSQQSIPIEELLGPDPIVLHWEKNPKGSPLQYTVRQVNADGAYGPNLTRAEVDKMYQGQGPVVNSGTATQDASWHEHISGTGKKPQTVIWEENSANNTRWKMRQAVALGDLQLRPETTMIFNALPQQTGVSFSTEQSRMGGIGGTAKAWQKLNKEISSSSGERKFTTKVPTKRVLLDELNTGNLDVVMLYAHNGGDQIYLPNGERISKEELQKLNDRTHDPAVMERIIILAVCSTAAKPMAKNSMVSLLLSKGIARTVFATQIPYDARDIPKMFQGLTSGKSIRAAVSSAGGSLMQYTELQPQAPIWRTPESEGEREGRFGE